VCLFDDDILPQVNWIKNCLDTINTGTDGILGGSGVLLPANGGYSSKHKVGWNGHHYDKVTRVDLVGHAWFFDKQYLKYLWEEAPHSWENGEDIHFSAMALKQKITHCGVAGQILERQLADSLQQPIRVRVITTIATVLWTPVVLAGGELWLKGLPENRNIMTARAMPTALKTGYVNLRLWFIFHK